MDKPCKHDWHWQPRNNHTELWNVCQLCGAERQLKIVSVEPLKHSSKLHEKKKRMGTSTINRRFDEIEKKDDSEY